MKKRILAVFLAAAALTCSLSACGGATTQTTAPSDETTPSSGEPHGNEITVGIAQDLESSLDPYQMTAAGTREVMFNVFEGLVKPDSSGNYVNAVASDVSISEDGLTYTFTLRDGVVFHNGETCTTEDVLYSFETCAATSWTSAVVEALSAVTDLRAEGNQVIVTLNAPNPDFLSYVSSVSIVPAGYDQQATQPVGTGPFKFVSRSVQENIILERHEDYYGTPAYLDRVTYRIYEDSNALFTALNSGALDLVAHLTSDQVSNLTNGYEVLEGTMNLVQALYLNHAVEPFNDVRVRQALCYAVDVDAMLALTAGGHGTKVGTSIYPAYKEVHDAGIPLVIAASGCAQEDEDAYNYYDTFVSTDEVEMGRAAADYANELLNGEGKIVMIRGVVESTNSWPGSWSPVPTFWYWTTWLSPFPAQDSGDWLIFCVPSPRQAALSSTPPIAMKIFSPLQTVFSSSAQALW